MKRIIAILCTLCMVMTMVPFSVMADVPTTVYKSWDGSTVPNTTDNGFTTTPATVLNPAAVTENLGGNSGPYMQFTAASVATEKNEVLVYSNGSLNYDAPYAAISINVYGKILQDMYARYSSNVKPAVTGNISGCLVADRWNNVFVAWDGAAKEATLYVNGTEIRTQNFYDFVEDLGTSSDTDTTVTTVDREANTWTWTNGTKNENGKFSTILNDVRMRFVKDSATDLVYSIDDIYVMTADTEITPAAYATVTSNDAVISNGSIVTKVNASNAALTASGAKIMVKRGDAWSESSVVTAGDEVVVITSTPYGNIYDVYTVTADTYDKFWDGSSSAALKSNIGWAESFLAAEFKTDGMGGKVNDTYVAYTGSASESVIYGGNSYSTRYFAMSINAYGQSIRDMFPRLASGSYKPSLVAQAKFGNNLAGLLTADIWNNVFFVFDSQTKDMKTYINGELKATVNLYDTIESSVYNGTVDKTAGTAKIGTTNINANLMNLKEDVRILLKNGSVSYIDDLAFMYTDYEPTPAAYVTTVTADNAALNGSYLVLNEGAETATVAANGATVMVNNGTAWSQTNTVKEGDQILLVTSTPYGNIYAPSVITVVGNTVSVATMDDMSFIQGGYPYVTDENGENGYNVKPTGAGNDVLLTDADDIFGSKMTMKELSVGYNFKNSTQTYYQTNWTKANVEKVANYLVVEADIAFPSADYVSGFSMSTNQGTTISSSVNYKAEYANRVNHYMWIYDIQAGTYVDYVNGKALVDEPVDVIADFANGTRTNIRFAANGKTKMTAVKTTDENGNQVDWIGTYEEVLKAYVANLNVYGAVNAPAVKAGPALEGAIEGYYPIYDTSAFTKGYIKTNLVKDDSVNTYVYTNRAYTDELAEDTDKANYFYMIVTEKDGLYGYYRVCQMPDANAEYAIETFTTGGTNGTARYVGVVNIGDTQDMTVILAETNGDDFVKCSYAAYEGVAKGELASVSIADVAADNTATVYVWDNFDSMNPLGATAGLTK